MSKIVTDRHFYLRTINSNYRYRIALPEELTSITETDLWNFSRKSLITDTDFGLEFRFISITDTRDTLWTPRGLVPEGPRRHSVGHSRRHPRFSGTLSGTLPETPRARRARETPVAGRGVRKFCNNFGQGGIGSPRAQ